MSDLLQCFASTIATWFTENVLSDKAKDNEVHESGALLFSLAELASFMNLNLKFRHHSENVTSPIESQRRGEVLYDPIFDNGNVEDTLIPNPFIIEKHFQLAIENMEKTQQQMSDYYKNMIYDPNDRSYAPPTQIHD